MTRERRKSRLVGYGIGLLIVAFIGLFVVHRRAYNRSYTDITITVADLRFDGERCRVYTDGGESFYCSDGVYGLLAVNRRYRVVVAGLELGLDRDIKRVIGEK